MEAMSTYSVTMRHDNGTAHITVAARSQDEAKRLVCEAEGAPLRSAIEVTTLTRGR